MPISTIHSKFDFDFSSEISPRQTSSQKIKPLSPRSKSSGPCFLTMVRVTVVGFLLLPFASSLWNCPTPLGKYTDSCDMPVGIPYTSSDSNLRSVKLCRYDSRCEMVDKPKHIKRNTTKYLSRADVACGQNWENCHGFLIARSDDTRLCTGKEAIKRQLQEHAFWEEQFKDDL